MMKRIRWVFVLPLIMAAFSFTTAIYADAPLDPDEITETRLIKQFHQIKRDGTLLEIKTSSSPVKFQDNPSGGESFSKSFAIESYSVSPDRTDFLIITHGYEGPPKLTLVNGATGATVDLTGKPILSPTRAHYLSYSMTLEPESDGDSPNVLKIIEARGFHVEFENYYEGNNEKLVSGPAHAKWIDANKIQVDEKERVTTDPFGVESPAPPAILEKIHGKWIQRPLNKASE
jgi:hypothetical protein